MEFKRAKLENLLDIFTLVQYTIYEIYPKYYSSGIVEFFSKIHTKEKIEQDIKDGSVWILVDNNILIGTCTNVKNFIMRLFIHPKVQNRGYGSKFLDFMENLILEIHSTVILEASFSTVKMYEKRGYATVNHEKILVNSSAILVYEIMRLEKFKSSLSD